MIIINLKGIWKIVLTKDRTIARLKPALATSNKDMLERPLTFFSTWLPKMSKFGSAIATKKAITPPDVRIKNIFLLRIRAAPKKEPIGIIPISIPCRKNVNPIITSVVPKIKEKKILGGSGVILKCNATTKIGIGNKDKNTDLNWYLILFILLGFPWATSYSIMFYIKKSIKMLYTFLCLFKLAKIVKKLLLNADLEVSLIFPSFSYFAFYIARLYILAV